MQKKIDKAELNAKIEAERKGLSLLQEIVESPNECVKAVRREIEHGTISGVFSDDIFTEIKAGKVKNNRTPITENIIFNIYKHAFLTRAIKKTKEDFAQYNAQFNQQLEKIKPVKSKIKWLFTSKEKKSMAYAAFGQLNDLTFQNCVNSHCQEYQNISYQSVDNVWNNFQSNKKEYLNHLWLMVGEYPVMQNVIPSLTEKIKETNDIQKRIKNFRNEIEEIKNEISATVDYMQTQKAFKILEDISVNELKKNILRLRTKALKDNGIYTIRDIFGFTSQQLSKIRGISEENAYAIKGQALEYFSATKKTTHIRLSTDEKTDASSKLIKAIYNYQKYKNLEDQILENPYIKNDEIENAKQKLETVTDSIEWIFKENIDKETIFDAYKQLQIFSDCQYEKSIEALNKDISSNDAWSDFEKHPVDYVITLEKIAPDVVGIEDELYGLPEELAEQIKDEDLFPDGLLCTLRPYQILGVKYILHQRKVLLGDEMGLGKTIQAIASMVSLKNTGAVYFIVVCPASVLANWCREIKEKSRLHVIKIHGRDRENAFHHWLRIGGVAVTTFEGTEHFHLRDDFRFSELIVDEAHYIKNAAAKRSKNVRNLSKYAERILFMTGTALENDVSEMVSLINALRPDIAKDISNMTYLSRAPQFREKIAPVYYRRKREQVLTELPEKEEIRAWCSMTPMEVERYKTSLFLKIFMQMRRVSWEMDDLKFSSKARRLQEIVVEASNENRKILVFSFFLDTIKKIKKIFGQRCLGPITGSIPPSKRQMMIDDFNKAPDGSILVSQIQSGGTGLNIQSASVVVICEPQLKPSIESQAISRAYRMNQSRKVLVYHLLCENSVDERIISMLERIISMLEDKQKQFDAFANDSVSGNESIKVEIDAKSQNQIIQEEIDRINAEST